MRGRSAEREILEQHQRQPQREQRAHDDHGHEAHRAEGLLLNVGHAEEEAEESGQSVTHGAETLSLSLPKGRVGRVEGWHAEPRSLA